ncbi:MAG: hypothetical protein IJ744_04550, partial [Lachnospiraceae bacterium]|nr:hypothetical protein [Lachnospiraceae bacterium]
EETDEVDEETDEVDEDTDEVDENTDEVEEETDEVDEETDEVDEDTDEVDEETDEVDEETDEVDENTDEVDEDADEVDEETDEVDEDTDEVDEETDEVDEETDEVEEETEEVDEETDEVNEETDEVDEDTDEVDEETEEVDENTDEVDEETDEVDEDTDEVDEDTDEVDEETDEVEEDTDEVNEETDEVDEDTDEVEEETDEVDENIDEVDEETDEVDEETEEVEEETEEVDEDTEDVEEETEEVDEETEEVEEETEEVEEETDEVEEDTDEVDEDTEEVEENTEEVEEETDEETDEVEEDTDETVEENDELEENTEETDEDSEEDHHYTSVYDYMTSHNYGREDFETYSQDPEWRELMQKEYPDYELPELRNKETSERFEEESEEIKEEKAEALESEETNKKETEEALKELKEEAEEAEKKANQKKVAKVSDQIEEINEKNRFGTLETDNTLNGSDVYIKGDNYEAYKKDFNTPYGEMTYERYDTPKEIEIDPNKVEGISISERELDDPSIFWSQHEKDGSLESFKEIANHIPEVKEQLASGKTTEELLEDPELGECTSIYFVNKPKVIEHDGYYEFQDNGRHRILAAREAGQEIPVEVVGREYRNDGAEFKNTGMEGEEIAQGETGNEVAETKETTEEKKPLSDRVNDALSRPIVDEKEIGSLSQENKAALEAKQEEKAALAAATTAKFDELSHMDRKDPSFKEKLAEYNAMHDSAEKLNDEERALRDQQYFLDQKTAEIRENKVDMAKDTIEFSKEEMKVVDELNERFDQQIYERKPDKNELASLREDNANAMAELQRESDLINEGMDAKMKEMEDYITSHNMDRHDTYYDAHYKKLTEEYNEMSQAKDRLDYNKVKLEENNKQIKEILGDEPERDYEKYNAVDLKNGEVPKDAFTGKTKLKDVSEETKLEELSQKDYEKLQSTDAKAASDMLTEFNERHVKPKELSEMPKELAVENERLKVVDEPPVLEKAKVVDETTGETYEIYPNPMIRTQNMEGQQGNNDVGMQQDCGIASAAKGVNDLYGAEVTCENRMVHYAKETGNCDMSKVARDVYGNEYYDNCGGTVERNVKEFYEANGCEAEAYEDYAVPSLDEIADKLKDGDVVSLAVNAELLWYYDDAQNFDLDSIDDDRYDTDSQYADYVDAIDAIQTERMFKANHFVNVSNAVFDSHGNLTHFIVSDTGIGKTKMIAKEDLQRAYNSSGSYHVSRQGCVIARRRK